MHITTSSARVPRQNGIIEQRWRILGNDVRTMLLDAKLPASWWWYAVRARQQVAWCLPYQRAQHAGHSPWSLFTGHRPNGRQHRIFGCLGYYKDLSPGLPKLAARARRALVLGRADDQPGYVLFDLEKRTFIVSPHVRTCEDQRPGLSASPRDTEPSDPELLFLHSPLGASPSPPTPPPAVVPPPPPDSDTPEAGPPPPPLPSSTPFDADNADTAPADEPLSRGLPTRASASPYMIRNAPVATALTALGVPPSGPFFLYLCSGPARHGSVSEHVRALGGPTVVNVDTKVGGCAMDITRSDVAALVLQVAALLRCLGVLTSISCKT